MYGITPTTAVQRLFNETRARNRKRTNMKKIYVGNLAFTTTEDTVRELFATHGEIESIALITDQVTGRPRGFGFVEMSSEGADAAIQALNGQEVDGRSLRISEARPRNSNGGSQSRQSW